MDPGVFSILGKLGTAGALAVVAWLFWDKSRRVAYICLAVAVLSGIVITAREAVLAWTDYSVQLSPPPEPRWGGFYETGEPVESISATLLRNGEPVGQSRKVGSLGLEERELRAELDPTNDGRMLVKLNDFNQGYVSFQDLDPGLREKIFSGTSKPYALSDTNEVNDIGDFAVASGGSAVKREFEELRMRVVRWTYDPVGLVLDIYLGDDRVAEALITRDQALAITRPEMKLIIGLLVLDLKEDSRRRARFVLLKYL